MGNGDDMAACMRTVQLIDKRFDALGRFETSPLFTDAERAALAACSEALGGCTVSDETFARLRAHFDERAIVEIFWANAAEAYFNLQTGPLGIPSEGLAARADQA